MARSDKRYMVYPAPRAIEIIGSTSPSLNQALECWAALLARATADNAKTFREAFDEPHSLARSECHPFHEWGLLAEVLKELQIDPEFAKPGELLAAAVEDAHRLENVGYNWFLIQEYFESDSTAELVKRIQTYIDKVANKLRELDYVHAWAIIVAVRWLWQHHKGINIEREQWWTLAFRRTWEPNEAQKRNNQGDSTDQKQGKRKKPEAEKRK